MLLKHYLDRGVSKSELSRRFGVSRRTIYDWIEAGELDRDLEAAVTRYSPRPRRKHKLDPYKGIIDARLAEFPRLSAQRLFDEIRTARRSPRRARRGICAGEFALPWDWRRGKRMAPPAG